MMEGIRRSSETMGLQEEPATKIEAPVEAAVHVEADDATSNGTEVSSSESAVIVSEANGSEAAAPAAAEGAEPPFKLAIPEPVEKATAVAVAAIKEWWAQLEPLLRALMKQVETQMEPIVKASMKMAEDVQAKMAPHLEPATELVAKWKAELEPHTAKVMDAVTKAAAAVKVQAYEPALAYIAVASAALKEHSVKAAALVGAKSQLAYAASKEWLVAQKPVIEALYAEAARRSAAMMQALLEWKERITPIVAQQLEAARVRAIELSKEGAVKLHEAQLKLVAESKKLGAQIEPHLTAAQAKAALALAPALKSVEPQIEAVKTFAEETQKKVAPVLVPVGAALQEWGKILQAQWALVSKQLEEPIAAVQAWLVQSAQCLCLPLLKPITYDAAAQADYPPPTLAVEPAKP